MTRVRIENASYLLTVDDTDRVLRNATVVIEDGVITAIRVREAGERPHALRPPDDAGGAGGAGGDVVIDARGKLVMPGLVNLHTHLPMTLLRGLAENVDLQGFLTRVWAAEGAVMDPETVELGATLGALESLLGGCTTQLDMYFHHEATHRGAVAAGSRHVIGPVFFDGPGPDGLAWEERLAHLRAWPALLDEIGGPRVPVAAMPHATYTCSPEGLAEVVTVLREVLAAGDRPGHGHDPRRPRTSPRTTASTSGTTRPRPSCSRAAAGSSPTSPSSSGTACTSASATARLLAGGGAAVAHCPGSNLKLASGALPGSRCATAASGSGSAPTGARAPTTSTCGRRCARPHCSPA